MKLWKKMKVNAHVFVLWLVSLCVGFSFSGYFFLKADVIWEYAVWLFMFLTGTVLFQIVMIRIKKRLHGLRLYGSFTDDRVALRCVFIFALHSIIYWIAFYPANMYVDTYYQFTQIFGSLPPGDWHSYGHTLFMKGIMRLTQEPAAIVLVQMVAMLYIIYLIFCELCRLGYRSWFLYATSILLSINIPYGLQITNIWKDTMYTISMLYVVYFLYKNYEFGFTNLKAVWIGICGFLGMLLFRHNGFVVCLVIWTVMLAISRLHKKTVIFVGILCCSWIVFVNYGFSLMGVQPNAKVTSYLPMLHGMAAVEKKYGEEGLDLQTKQLMEELLPAEVWTEKYDPYNGDPYLFNTDEILTEKCEFYTVWDILLPYMKTFLRHPFTLIKDRLASCELAWSFAQPPDSYNYIVGSDNSSFENDERLFADFQIWSMPPNRITEFIRRCFDFINGHMLLQVLHFRPAWLMWILGAVFIVVEYDRKSMVIALPVCMNMLSLLIAMNFQAYRYVWGVFACVPLIVLLLLGKNFPAQEKKGFL